MWIHSNINRLSLIVALVGFSLYGGCVLIIFKQNKVKLTMWRIPKGRRLMKSQPHATTSKKTSQIYMILLVEYFVIYVPCFLKVQITYSCETNICHR